MSEYFGRRFEVLINDEIFIEQSAVRQFKIKFEILVDFGGYISYADISIYNLKDDTAAKVFKRNALIGLRAGYVDSIDYIFKGNIRNVFKERAGPDTITRIIARGGSAVPSNVEATLGPNSTVVDAIRTCSDALGYPLVIKESDFADISPFPRGYVMSGDPRAYLDKLAIAANMSYVIENDRLIVVRNTSHRDGTIFVVSKETGMEGIPEITEIGCDVSVRLQPKLKIGGRVDIQTTYATFNFSNLYYQDVPASAGKGIYRIFRLRHTGDSWGTPWTTKVTGYR